MKYDILIYIGEPSYINRDPYYEYVIEADNKELAKEIAETKACNEYKEEFNTQVDEHE